MASEIIPSDLVYVIFSQLPAKSLFRFRCVSSVFRSIIDDPYLAYMQQTRCAEEPNYVLLFHLLWPYRTGVIFTREGRKFSKAATRKACYDILLCNCNGLLCFREIGDHSHLVLFNPLREQVVSLSPTPAAAIYPSRPPLTDNTKYGFGFDYSKNTYKIVRVFDDECSSTRTFYAEIFTLGTRSWRAISKGPPCFLFKSPVFVCGNIYWFSYPEDEDEEEEHDDQGHPPIQFSKIVSFDISKEEFGLIYAPIFMGSHLPIFMGGHLLDLNGKLAIVDISPYRLHVDIWVLMKEYERKDHWVKEYEIDLKLPGREFFFTHRFQIVGQIEFGQVLIVRYLGELFSCDPKNGTLEYIHIPEFCFDTEVLCQKSSILSISMFQANY